MGCSSLQALNQPPKGFTPLFNGKDLTGFRGGDTFDHRKLLAMPEADRAAQIAKWTKTLTEVDTKTGKPNWHVENGELVNGGNGAYATTEKDYGDFELLLEYKTVPLADSGIYLRGVPQVQIWDYTEKAKFNLGANKGRAASGTILRELRARIHSCWPTSRLASGIRSASSWSVRG